MADSWEEEADAAAVGETAHVAQDTFGSASAAATESCWNSETNDGVAEAAAADPKALSRRWFYDGTAAACADVACSWKIDGVVVAAVRAASDGAPHDDTALH